VDVSVLWPDAVEQLPSITDVFNFRFCLSSNSHFIDTCLSMDSSTDVFL